MAPINHAKANAPCRGPIAIDIVRQGIAKRYFSIAPVFIATLDLSASHKRFRNRTSLPAVLLNALFERLVLFPDSLRELLGSTATLASRLQPIFEFV